MGYQEVEKRIRKLEIEVKKLRKELNNLKSLFEGPSFYIALSLPDHLRKSYSIAKMLGIATADDVSLKTGRARAVESAYLNQLVLMGYLEKERKDRKVYFKCKE